MENEEIKETNEETRESNKKTPIILFALLFVLSMGLNVFLFFNYVRKGMKLEQQNAELIELLDISQLHVDSLQAELDAAISSFQQKLDESYAIEGNIRTELEQKIVELEKARNRISGLIASGGEGGTGGSISLAKAKKEIEALKASNAEYLKELDELKKVYAIAQNAADHYSGQANTLQVENDSLTIENSSLRGKISDLAILHISDLMVAPIQEKRGKQVVTEKASRVDHLKISFSVLPSKAITEGKKDISVRIVGANGTVLSDDVSSLTDSDQLVSMTQNVIYDGTEQKVVLFFYQKAEYKEGTHTVEIIQSGKLLDRFSFTLH